MLNKLTAKFTIVVMTTISIAATTTKASNIESDPIAEFLSDVDTRFRVALPDDQYGIVSHHYTLTEVRHFGDQEFEGKQDPHAITYRVPLEDSDSFYEFQSDRINPLAVAICAGRSDLVEKWIQCVPDINALELWVRGFRQPANLAHIAVNFGKPMRIDGAPDWRRKEIIEILGQHGADFNTTHKGGILGIYDNPALHAINLDGTHEKPVHVQVAATALLQGADPSKGGSSRSLVVINETSDRSLGSFGSDAIRYCEQALDLMLGGTAPNQLAPSVREELTNIRDQRISALQALSFETE